MTRKLFSIITPTYNCGPKVENTIRSVLSQRRDLFEYVIVDGGSTDETLPIVRKYEGELSVFSEKDGGVYDAFNKGIDQTSGRYLYFLGAGDCLREGVLEKIRSGITDDRPSLIYGDVFVVNRNGYCARRYTKSDIRRMSMCHQAIFYERSVFDLVGRYDLKYNIHADWVLNMRCFGNRNIRKQYVKCVVADFEGGGLSETQEDLNFHKDYEQVVKALGATQYALYKVDVGRAYWQMFGRRVSRVLRRAKPRADAGGREGLPG